MTRLAALLLTAFAALAFSRPAPAATIILPRPCVLTTEANATPAKVIAQAARFDCAKRGRYVSGKVNWALFDRLDLASRPSDPWLFRNSYGRERDTKIYVQFADGSLVPSPTGMAAARQFFSSADVVYRLPQRDVPMTAILVRVAEMDAVRGILPRAALDTQAERARVDSNYHMFWGAFFGMIGAILIFNAMLYFVMRHRFQLYYCLFALSALAFAFSWSGGIFLLFPDLSTFWQVRANVFAISACVLTTPIFFLSFLEPGTISRRMSRAILALSVCPLFFAVFRTIVWSDAWQLFDQLFYLSMLSSIVLMSVASLQALRRGSKAARFIVLSWSVPYLITALRVLWAINIITLHNGLFDVSPFLAIGYEAMVSAMGIGWRIRELRRERDLSLGRENALRALAETDPLSGLLNRRAFLERAVEDDRLKGLALFDIDHFKSINDRFGHDVGDQVIAAFAALIGETLPAGGVAGRMGGEEFAVLLPGGRPEEFARRICHAVERLAWTPDGSAITVSAGVVTERIGSEPEWRRAYIAADGALLDAKRGGRNRVVEAKKALAA